MQNGALAIRQQIRAGWHLEVDNHTSFKPISSEKAGWNGSVLAKQASPL